MIKIIILAAGKGKRMQSSLPKVLVPLKGRPMVSYLLDAVIQSGVDSTPVLVVSPDNEAQIRDNLASYDFNTVIQVEQQGTGHALRCGIAQVAQTAERVIVFNGDHPFISSATIKKLAAVTKGIAMLTVELEDFDNWRKVFVSWGRIIVSNNQVKEIVEVKDATESVKELTTVNPAMYSFDLIWLRENIGKLKNENAQGEYYLTDLIKLAYSQNLTITSIPVEAKEAIGINSMEELAIAEALMTESN